MGEMSWKFESSRPHQLLYLKPKLHLESTYLQSIMTITMLEDIHSIYETLVEILSPAVLLCVSFMIFMFLYVLILRSRVQRKDAALRNSGRQRRRAEEEATALKQELSSARGIIEYLRAYANKMDTKRNRGIENAISNEDNQLAAVAQYDGFYAQPIFNKSEARLFYLIKDALLRLGLKDWHVHGQVSLGEILKTGANTWNANRAFQSINSKRADMLIADNFGSPIAVFEYQGEGHQGNDAIKTEKRDEIKRTAITKAGILFIEIFPSMREDERRILVEHTIKNAVGSVVGTD